MKQQFTVAACQLSEIRQDIRQTLSIINKYSELALARGATLLCFPECYLQGYLLDRPLAGRYALDAASPAFDNLLKSLPAQSPVLVIGLIESKAGRLYNAAAVIKDRSLLGIYRKTHLLSGEHIFDPGTDYPVFQPGKLNFGINICYDTNFASAADSLARLGAQLIVCPANNLMGKEKSARYKDLHHAVRADRCRETGLWLLSADVCGTQGGRVSYGPTALLAPDGSVAEQLPLGRPGMLVADLVIDVP